MPRNATRLRRERGDSSGPHGTGHLTEDELAARFLRASRAGSPLAGHFGDRLDNHADAIAARDHAATAALLHRNLPALDRSSHRRLLALHDIASAHGDEASRRRLAREIDARERELGYGHERVSEEQARAEYRDLVGQQYREAVQATNAQLYNPASRLDASGHHRHDLALWQQPAHVAQAWASEELLRYWQEHPRITWAEYRHQRLGTGAAAAAASRKRGSDLTPDRRRRRAA